MKYFGTFDTISEEEDRIYNRLAVIRRERGQLDYSMNEIQQEIKQIKNQMLDDKFKIKMWLAATLICGFIGIFWQLIPAPSVSNPMVGYIVGVIATFMMLLGSAVALPMCGISLIVLIVHLVRNYLRNGKSESAMEAAAFLKVKNRNVIIAEHKVVVRDIYEREEALKVEEEELQRKLAEIQKNEKTEKN